VRKVPCGIKAVSLDFEKPETFRDALTGVEKVSLLNVPAPDVVEVAGRFIDAAKAAGVAVVVKLSGLAPETMIIGRWLRVIERHLEESGIAWTSPPRALLHAKLLHPARSDDSHTIRVLLV
jgi:uncharacterized protein YbjT (DUF2867 family)